MNKTDGKYGKGRNQGKPGMRMVKRQRNRKNRADVTSYTGSTRRDDDKARKN